MCSFHSPGTCRRRIAIVIMLLTAQAATLLLGCGNGTTSAANQTVTLSRSFTVTYFQNQNIVGSANRQAVGRLMVLGNVAHAPSGYVNAIVFGYTGADGLPTGIAEVAAWQDDPAKAVYSMYDGSGKLIKVLQPQTGNSLTISYNTSDPTQFTVTFFKPDGTVAGTLAGTANANNKITFHSVAPVRNAVVKTTGRIGRSSRVSIDPDDNPSDNDSDDAVPNVNCNDLDQYAELTCKVDKWTEGQRMMQAGNQKAFSFAELISLAIASLNVAGAEGLDAVSALLDFKDLQEKIGATGIALQSLSAQPASNGISNDNTGKGVPAYQATPTP